MRVTCSVCGRPQEGAWIWVGDGTRFGVGEGRQLTGDYCSVGCLQTAIDALQRHEEPRHSKRKRIAWRVKSSHPNDHAPPPPGS